ncbi:CD48 antigen-like isoform X1 [Paramisgurnus dabryanus]|uniref:CD48 antigen-like isoform X1 n=1 Tax=Paramisgurnus dabryanus TaxID=90735 RepID=UPI0031F38CA2
MKPTFIHLYSSLSSGFSTEDTVFVKTGASVQLNIQRDKLPDEFEEIFWQNEKSDTIVKYYNKFKDVKYFDDYKDRVDFNTESFSLTLKNMKKTDSGVYTAKITGKSNRDVAEHRVSVIGFSTEDTVFVKTGASVELNIQRDKLPDKFDDIYWQNEKSQTIVKYYNKFKAVQDYPSYKDRVEFNNESFSLTLKNMKKTDSGVYTAKITGTTNRDVAEHRVSVIDAVKTPELTVISNWSSSDSCTVNFTCRAHDLTLNSIYNNDNCSPEKVTSNEKFTLILICSNEAIICNHSNHISWKTDRIDITQLCKGKYLSAGPSSKTTDTIKYTQIICYSCVSQNKAFFLIY